MSTRRGAGGGGVPPPPWHTEVDALLWWHRAAPEAAAALPPVLAGRAAVAVTVAGLVSYRSSPVGPYREVFASPVLLRPGPGVAHAAFMAVDSPASLAGGRENWALPKVPAAFASDPASPDTVAVTGDGWALTVSASARPRAAPAWAAGTCAQVWPDGHVRGFAVRLRGRARLARVKVRHDAPSELATWLLAGRHPAVLLSGRQVVSMPR